MNLVPVLPLIHQPVAHFGPDLGTLVGSAYFAAWINLLQD